MSDLDTRLYELNCANAEWHEATGESLPGAQRKFQDALQWFRDRNIPVHTIDDATHRGIYVIGDRDVQAR